MAHPLKSHDPDKGCRWLCETAGTRSVGDDEAIADALSELPHEGKPLVMPTVPNVWDVVD